jgi:hypothetical protein
MKKLIITLIINLTILSTTNAQIPKEAFNLKRSMASFLNNEETEKAIAPSLELFHLYSPFFVKNIHFVLAKNLNNDIHPYGLKYLEQLFIKENQEINDIIAPIYLWSKAIFAEEEQATHHRNATWAREEQIHHPLQILPEPTKTLSRIFMKPK